MGVCLSVCLWEGSCIRLLRSGRIILGWLKGQLNVGRGKSVAEVVKGGRVI